ncbi:unnamed protein product [Nezara viridula]|uniref:Uncharacterized protein n=1 Tax=Nezara viridula TaxID=85310 RepID=A0A9P0H9Z8_NEZVI|nr:unnamed protein product [Nezara viridula]
MFSDPSTDVAREEMFHGDEEEGLAKTRHHDLRKMDTIVNHHSPQIIWKTRMEVMKQTEHSKYGYHPHTRRYYQGQILPFWGNKTFVSSGNSKTPGELPTDCGTLSSAAVDLVKRLLTADPMRRLRSLLTLQTLPFFMGFDLSKVKMKKVI